MTQLPKALAKDVCAHFEREWENVDRANDAHDGATWLYHHLLEKAPEFDKGAAMTKWNELVIAGTSDLKWRVLNLAHWQHEQSKAQVAALEMDVADLRMSCRDKQAVADELVAERDAALAEVERLKRELAEAKREADDCLVCNHWKERTKPLVKALEWAYDGIEHFCEDEDQAQVKYLRDGIWSALERYKGEGK